MILNPYAIVIDAYATLVGKKPGSSSYADHKAYINANGQASYVSALESIFSNTTNASMGTTVLANLGLSSVFTAAEGEAYFAANAGARVQAALNLASLLSNYAGSDAAILAAKTSYNNTTANAYEYASNSANTTDAASSAEAVSSGQTFTLTTGVDTFSGSTGNDIVNAALTGTATTNTYNSFDNLNGGAGDDVLNIASSGTSANYANPPSVTLAGFETVNVSHTAGGGTGTGAIAITNTTFGTGVKSLNYVDASVAADMTAATVAVTLNDATDVSVKATGTGTFTTVAITDTSTTAAATGSSLETVTIQKASGANTLTGNGIKTVNLNAAGGLTTVTAAAGTRDLTVNASGTTTQGGLTDAQATTATLNVTGAQTFGTLTVAKAGSVAINTNAATTMTLASAAATSLALGGSNLNTLTVTGGDPIATVTITGAGGVSSDLSGLTALTTVDTTGSTAVAPASGSLTGPNTITIGTSTAYNGGGGQDKVTVGATTKAVSLGAGNDTAIVSVTALGSGGSITGGDGTDVLKLSNANAVTLSTAGTAQAAFKAAVTGFETLDITTQTGSTVDVSKMGTFDQVNMVSASAAQILAGVTSGMTIQSTYGAAGTSITTNTLTSPTDSMTLVLKGDLSTAARVFGSLVNPGVENLTVTTSDTSTTVTARLATLTVTDANLQSITVNGNNGLALTHAGTSLYNIDASGVTKGGFTFTSGALATDTTAKGTALGGDTIDLSSAVAKTNITVYKGTNTIKGSSGAYANTLTGGTGNDTIVGGSAVDTIVAGAGTTANTITGAGGADLIDLTGSTGADTIRYDTIATSANATGSQVDTITGFKAGSDKINFAQGALSLTGVTTDGTGDAVATMAAVVENTTSVATLANVYTALAAYTTLTASAADGTATVAQVYNFTNGAAAGTYLVVNDATVGFQAATDVVIKLVGTDGTISASDFTFAA